MACWNSSLFQTADCVALVSMIGIGWNVYCWGSSALNDLGVLTFVALQHCIFNWSI